MRELDQHEGSDVKRSEALTGLDRLQIGFDRTHKASGYCAANSSSNVRLDPRTVRLAIQARRAREAIFGSDLFADPAWDILLEAYAATLSQCRTSVTDLASAAAVPSTTALRWISKLENEGWLRRFADPFDARRSWLELTPKAVTAMERVAVETSLGLPV
jgi:hypothetical protein